LQTREWENKEGQKQRTTEVNALTVQFLGGGRGGAPAGPGRPSGRGASGAEPEGNPPDDAVPGPPADDEIPF
ncbi:MAG TPA: single-stranded DNA-binding protein, partial [Myxococcota bacterium]|nr:single-stranded DNA-binding protein [Myxococcota bacterium]